jgi:transcriptional regulator with XRE-family HTH domain
MALSQETVERNLRISHRITAQRKTLGMTQRELAVHLGLPYYTFISQVETGQATLPPALWKDMATVLLMDPLDFAIECLEVTQPDIYQQLFGTAKPSKVYASLSAVKDNRKE